MITYRNRKAIRRVLISQLGWILFFSLLLFKTCETPTTNVEPKVVTKTITVVKPAVKDLDQQTQLQNEVENLTQTLTLLKKEIVFLKKNCGQVKETVNPNILSDVDAKPVLPVEDIKSIEEGLTNLDVPITVEIVQNVDVDKNTDTNIDNIDDKTSVKLQKE